jgi:mono/diheme cytochrome c family protein
MFARSAAALTLSFACTTVAAQAPEGRSFSSAEIKRGADLFAQNCSPCHGAHMADPQGAFDLRKFPHEDKARFVTSVTRGKQNMPPWGDLLKPEDIDALWAYVVAGEQP